MPKRKKSLSEECESLINRQATLGSRKKHNLSIYVASLAERFASMDYALAELCKYCRLPGQSTTESYNPFVDHQQKRDFYANCFWAFGYSAFDVVAHVVNLIHPVVKDETQVSFVRAAYGYGSISKAQLTGDPLPGPVLTKIKKTTEKRYFKRLKSYRQCSLHRRAVCVCEEMTKVSLSVPYAGSKAEVEPRVVTWICDDPDKMTPKFSLKRRLEDEAGKLRSSIETDITEMVRLL